MPKTHDTEPLHEAADALEDAADQMLHALDGRRHLGPQVNRCRSLLKTRIERYQNAREGLDDDESDH